MARVTTSISRRRVPKLVPFSITVLLVLLLGNACQAAKRQGQITYEDAPRDDSSSRGKPEPKSAEDEDPSGARQAPFAINPVLPQVAYPGDLSAFFSEGSSASDTQSDNSTTEAAKPLPVTRRNGDAVFGERRSRVRRPLRTTRSPSGNQRIGHDNPYLLASPSTSVGVRVISKNLPGYDAPPGVHVGKFMETKADLTYEGAGFQRDDGNASPSKTGDSKNHKPVFATESNKFAVKSAPEIVKPVAKVSNVVNPELNIETFYPGQLAVEESSNYKQTVQRPSHVQPPRMMEPPRRPQPVGQEPSLNYQPSRYPQDLIPAPSQISSMGRGPIPFGIPIQIPPTYSFYPTIGHKGYYVTQESAPGTFVQTSRGDTGLQEPAVLKYNAVQSHVFQRIKRETVDPESLVKPSKSSPIKKGSSKSIKLSLTKEVLGKHSDEDKKANETKEIPTIVAVPEHLDSLSKMESKMQQESSEFIPSFGNFPFFGSEDVNSGEFGLYNSKDESRGSPRNGQTYGARPRGRQRGHRGPAYRASESKSFGYGILGSGNFEVVRGGIYSDNRPSASRVPMHHGAESYGGYDYDDVDDEPIMGFQGYNNFGSLHNALASKKRESTVIPANRRSSGSAPDHSTSSSQLIETSLDLDAVD